MQTLDLLEGTDTPCARGHQGITRCGRVAAPSDAMADRTQSQQQQNPSGPAPAVLGTAWCWECQPQPLHTPPVCSSFGHVELRALLSRSPAAEHRPGQEEVRACLTPPWHCSFTGARQAVRAGQVFRTAAGVQRPNPLPTQLRKLFCSQYQFSASSKEVFPPVKPLWDSYSQEKHTSHELHKLSGISPSILFLSPLSTLQRCFSTTNPSPPAVEGQAHSCILTVWKWGEVSPH